MKTLNIVNCFKDHKRYINIFNRIWNLVCLKYMKLALEKLHMCFVLQPIPCLHADELATLGSGASAGMVLTPMALPRICFMSRREYLKTYSSISLLPLFLLLPTILYLSGFRSLHHYFPLYMQCEQPDWTDDTIFRNIFLLVQVHDSP